MNFGLAEKPGSQNLNESQFFLRSTGHFISCFFFAFARWTNVFLLLVAYSVLF
ncbi:MAG: hypothetical protein AB7O38_27785 [Pirellulaceae bacterium]